MAAFFELERFTELPLWAQAYMASRAARRAVLSLPRDVPDAIRRAMLDGCDAIDRCCVRAGRTAEDIAAIERAVKGRIPRAAEHAALAVYFAGDSAHAAESSSDFYAAEAACGQSAAKAMDASGRSPGLNPVQARIMSASDYDTLRFACAEAGLSRYSGLGKDVPLRMAPVHPPDERAANSPHPMAGDPTGGAR